MAGNREVKRARSMGSTEDVGREGRKTAEGILLQGILLQNFHRDCGIGFGEQRVKRGSAETLPGFLIGVTCALTGDACCARGLG